MTPEEFEKWVYDKTDYSVLDVADVDVNDNRLVVDIVAIKDIAQAYLEHRVNEVTENDIIEELSSRELTIGEIVGFSDATKWFKEQLLKK